MNPTTRSHVTGQVRALADAGDHMIELQPITPYVVDDYGSVWAPDVFDESLAVRMPTLAWAHSWHEPIGRAVDWEARGDLRVVRFRLDNFDDVPLARRAYAQVMSGTIDDCSVGFSNAKRRYGGDLTPDELVRWPGMFEFIERADLDETSLVLRGAVPGAKVMSIRAASGRAVTVAEEQVLEVARKVAAGDMTEAEGKAYLALVADDTPDQDGGAPGGTGVPDGNPDEVMEAEAALDEALASLERSR